MIIRLLFLLVGISFSLSGCETSPVKAPGPPVVVEETPVTGEDPVSPPEAVGQTQGGRIRDEIDKASAPDFLTSGSGVFIAPQRSVAAITEASGDVTLNMERIDIREAVKIILGDLLGKNYTIDPRVQGVATLQTSGPVNNASLIPTLEMLLRMNGAALIQQGDSFHIVPREIAMREAVQPQLGDSQISLPQGFGIRIVPLKYIAAREMQKILEPLIQQGSLVRIDEFRNLLILSGTGNELVQMLETIRIFDVDWLEGMSVALFSPSFVDARVLAGELEKIFSEEPLAGLLRFTVFDRLNAVLVMSPRKTYIDKVAQWIDRLDKETDVIGRRLFVHKVLNSKAADIAQVLGDVFAELEGEVRQLPQPQIIPGREAIEIRSPGFDLPMNIAERPSTQDVTPSGVQSMATEEGVVVTTGGRIRIIADEINNALVILSTPEQYRQIQTALRQLDVVPMQVLIEATIAEITLTDDFRFGLEWFFTNRIDSNQGRAGLDLDSIAGIATGFPAFSYTLTDSAGIVRGVLNTLAADSKLNVISSPSLMVLNNQTASIQVGDQVPVTTQQQQSTGVGSTIINSIEFRDTGVLLTVTPRVNPGGLVIMEIEQEVSDVAPDSFDLTPTIRQRRITSSVAIESGETVVLGGLIRENQSSLQSGIPFLYKLPIIGPLFGSINNSGRRTELVVLITPRSIQGTDESRKITEEYRNKMESLKPLYEASPAAPPGP